MKDKDIIKCCEVILDFLEDDSKDLDMNVPSTSFDDCVTFKKMNDTLKSLSDEYGVEITMISFTLLINGKYKLYKEPLWEFSGREFFSSFDSVESKAITLYKMALRDLKIGKILN
jgi:hypothetical protein